MTNLTTKLNKLMLDGAPAQELIHACVGIDIESCFDPIFEPPIDFLETVGKPDESVHRYGGAKNRKYLVSAGDCM